MIDFERFEVCCGLAGLSRGSKSAAPALPLTHARPNNRPMLLCTFSHTHTKLALMIGPETYSHIEQKD